MPTIEVRLIRPDDTIANELDSLRRGAMLPLAQALERYASDTASPDGPILAVDWRASGNVTGIRQVDAGKLRLEDRPPGESPLGLRLRH